MVVVKKADATEERGDGGADAAALVRELRSLWKAVPPWPGERWCAERIPPQMDGAEVLIAGKANGRQQREGACGASLRALRACYGRNLTTIDALQWRYLQVPQRRRSESNLHGHGTPERLSLDCSLGCKYQCAECVAMALRALDEIEKKLDPPAPPEVPRRGRYDKPERPGEVHRDDRQLLLLIGDRGLTTNGDLARAMPHKTKNQISTMARYLRSWDLLTPNGYELSTRARRWLPALRKVANR